jgi:F420-dependent oxidoreductase-like protein
MRDRIGLAFNPGDDVLGAIDLIARADQAGLTTAWLVMPAMGLDSLTLFAAALGRTEQIRIGTAIVPAFTRHPLTVANQARVLEQLAPGRLRLGIGTAHARTMVDVYHLPFGRPLAQLREYLDVLRPLLQTGEVHFTGEFYEVDATLPQPLGTPVLIAALRPPAFELAGSHSDGAISWNCPVDYLMRVAKPALARGADAVGRPAPPMLVHVPVVTSPVPDRVRAVARQQLAYYAAAPFYARMFADAGVPLDAGGHVTDELIGHLVVSGDEDEIRRQLVQRLEAGSDELLVNLLPGPDRRADEDALLRVLSGF